MFGCSVAASACGDFNAPDTLKHRSPQSSKHPRPSPATTNQKQQSRQRPKLLLGPLSRCREPCVGTVSQNPQQQVFVGSRFSLEPSCGHSGSAADTCSKRTHENVARHDSRRKAQISPDVKHARRLWEPLDNHTESNKDSARVRQIPQNARGVWRIRTCRTNVLRRTTSL